VLPVILFPLIIVLVSGRLLCPLHLLRKDFAPLQKKKKKLRAFLLSLSSSFLQYRNLVILRNCCLLPAEPAFPEIALPVLASSISSAFGQMSSCLAALPVSPVGGI
jgi:hypothetical protein